MSPEAWRRSRTDVAPRSFAWQAWHFRHLRLDLRGRRGTFATSIDVRGSSATNWVGLTPLHFTMYVCTYVIGTYVRRYVGT